MWYIGWCKQKCTEFETAPLYHSLPKIHKKLHKFMFSSFFCSFSRKWINFNQNKKSVNLLLSFRILFKVSPFLFSYDCEPFFLRYMLVWISWSQISCHAFPWIIYFSDFFQCVASSKCNGTIVTWQSIFCHADLSIGIFFCKTFISQWQDRSPSSTRALGWQSQNWRYQGGP